MQAAEGTFAAEARARRATPSAVTESVPAKLVLDPDGLTMRVTGLAPVRAAYRDLAIVAVEHGTLLLRFGAEGDAETWLVEALGDRLGPTARELRDGRLRQRLADSFVQLDEDPIELVEFASPPAGGSTAALAQGVGQLLVHRWGAVLAPLDERQPWMRWRRADLEVSEGAPGTVELGGRSGSVELRGLGDAATRHARRLGSLREAAFEDAARLIEALLPDAPFGVRRRASEVLVDGRPADRDALGEAWDWVERAALVDDVFAESYRALVAVGGGPASQRWFAMAPAEPAGDVARSWFFVPLPGNLVALELVSEGAHATYCFRVVPRAAFAAMEADEVADAAETAVRAVSAALVDARFLRAPMALPADQLASPRGLRYRLALAALPSLAEARERFVARIVHRDAASWRAALDDLVRWHGACRDDAAEWPGRAAQEAEVSAAAGSESEDD